ncbi:GDSL-type esterase/lipase family protein [Bradyrhizobium prioriisuperbiae]|uniref:GDSL-type esterase/lipase family protein n=1 Tax=Bradyrhizobium prioriisuperbiae TaxID=2854389 RepID=UPI0028EEF25A|nr:GDSL-type esterase/lipase family protein [Bradyrhizobium prioritasuperba]
MTTLPDMRRKTAGLSRRKATLLLGSCILGLGWSHAAAAVGDPLTPEMIARSRLPGADFTRLQRVFAKARRGERITLGVIGGSITEGSLATVPENSYVARVRAWWQDKFPRSALRLVNAGFSGTGSLYGVFRAQRDLLEAKPDLVVIEFAVNDASADAAAYEGLVRQILARPNAPALLLLFMMWEGGGNLQEMQAPIGAHYRLPMVSFRDALWPEMAAGRLRWSDFLVDAAHPNDAGHAVAARLVTALLDDADKAGVPDAGPLAPLPSPLHSDAYQFVSWRRSVSLTPSRNDGWTRITDDKGAVFWTGTEKSGQVSFEFSGTGIVAVVVRPPNDAGRVQFWVDGVAALTVDADMVVKRDVVVVAEGLAPGRHTLTMARVDAPGAGAASQTVALAGLGAIGVNRR